MKKRQYVTFILIIGLLASILTVNSVFNFMQCNMRRDYKVDTDRKIYNIQKKIAEIEEKKEMDLSKATRLADQYNQLGTVYLEKKLWTQAAEAFEKAMTYGNPGAPLLYAAGLAYANRGSAMSTAADFDRAEGLYRKALEVQDNFHEARYGLAVLLFYHRNKREEGLAMMEDLVARNRTHYYGRFTLGRFYYEMDRKDRALQVYEELHTDLEKLPPSEIINDFKKNCKDNISRVMAELSVTR